MGPCMMHTDIEKHGPILLLVDDMGFEYLVVQGLRLLYGAWHDWRD